jgi:hypothetical protein
MFRSVCVAALAVAAGALSPPAPQPLSVQEVMRRVATYVDGYGDRAAIVVATEHYTQATSGNTTAAPRTRSTVAEFAIVRLQTLSEWIGFRDVIDVEGRPVADRADRLVRSLTGSDGGYSEARRLTDESARFNIGPIQRNFNVPTTALFYFNSKNLERFAFRAKKVEADGTWTIAWRETARPTLIRTPEGDPVPGEGEIAVNPLDGAIRRTVLATALTTIRSARMRQISGRVEVTYRYEDPLGMWLPAEMVEMFKATGPSSAWERVDGRAVYSNYRQFTTSGRVK